MSESINVIFRIDQDSVWAKAILPKEWKPMVESVKDRKFSILFLDADWSAKIVKVEDVNPEDEDKEDFISILDEEMVQSQLLIEWCESGVKSPTMEEVFMQNYHDLEMELCEGDESGDIYYGLESIGFYCSIKTSEEEIILYATKTNILEHITILEAVKS